MTWSCSMTVAFLSFIWWEHNSLKTWIILFFKLSLLSLPPSSPLVTNQFPIVALSGKIETIRRGRPCAFILPSLLHLHPHTLASSGEWLVTKSAWFSIPYCHPNELRLEMPYNKGGVVASSLLEFPAHVCVCVYVFSKMSRTSKWFLPGGPAAIRRELKCLKIKLSQLWNGKFFHICNNKIHTANTVTSSNSNSLGDFRIR